MTDRGGRLNITTALNIIGYVRNETSYLPWVAVHKNLEYIFGILPVESKAYRQLKVSVDYRVDQSQSLSFSSYPVLEVLFFSFAEVSCLSE